MTKQTWIGIIVIIIIAIGGYYYSQNAKPAPVAGDPIKIGAILPLTGPIASSGEFSKNGIELAVKDLEKKGIKVEVLFEDNQYDAKFALSAYNKLKTVNNVDAVITFGAPPAMALSPVVNTDKIPTLAIVAATAYSSPNDFTFRMVGSAEFEAQFAVDTLVKKLGKKKVAVMYLNNDYGKGALAAFKKFAGTETTIVAEESSLPGASDYRAQLLKIKAANPEAVFLATLYKEAGTMIKQGRELGIKSVFMCGQPCENPEFVTTAGEAAEGAIVVAPVSDDKEGFNTLYEKTFGKKPSYISLRSYDAVKVLAEVAKQCVEEKYDGECLRSALDNLNDFPGLSYNINFDENGDINDQFVVKVIKDGKYVPYE